MIDMTVQEGATLGDLETPSIESSAADIQTEISMIESHMSSMVESLEDLAYTARSAMAPKTRSVRLDILSGFYLGIGLFAANLILKLVQLAVSTYFPIQ